MNIVCMSIKNFRTHMNTNDVPITPLTAFIGKNDSGKSSLLMAIGVFLSEKNQIDISDIYKVSNSEDNGDQTEIELMFGNYSEDICKLQILSSSNLLDLKKVFDHDGKLKNYLIKVNDYQDENFQRLWEKKESDLNKLLSKFNLYPKDSGTSITKETKIDYIRKYADSHQTIKKDVWYDIKGDVKELLAKELPTFEFYGNEVSLNTETASFQKPFQESIAKSIQEVSDLISDMEKKVKESVQEMQEKIKSFLNEQTDSVYSIDIVPEFDLKHFASVKINIIDKLDIDVPAERRGSGLKRLIMVSYLRYIAERSRNGGNHVIYAIEEPETSLHPGAQRVLMDSLKTLAANGTQVIFTTHSPVFVSDLNNENIIIVKRNQPTTQIIPGSKLKVEDVKSEIIEELGISPRDAILEYSYCVFVEGKTDVCFFEKVWKKLFQAGKIQKNMNELHIGFFPYGGDNLKFHVERGLLKTFSRRFAVIVDSDKKSPMDQMPQTKIKFKEKCEADGGIFISLMKREIENYIHKNAYNRIFNSLVEIEDYKDVKKELFNGENGNNKFIKVVEEMTADEILERDLDRNGNHELLDMINSLVKFFTA